MTVRDRLRRLKQRIVDSIVVDDPDPQYSWLDRMDGLPRVPQPATVRAAEQQEQPLCLTCGKPLTLDPLLGSPVMLCCSCDTVETLETPATPGPSTRDEDDRLSDAQYAAITRVVDRIKTDERNLDTDEYVALIESALHDPEVALDLAERETIDD